MSFLHLSRRRLLLSGGAASFMAFAPFPASFAAVDEADQPSAEEALQRLLAGNERYLNNQPHLRSAPDRAALAAGQAPFAAILACADSRVAPELVFDQGPGALFVVRIAGNFVTDNVLASLEYAVALLNVPLVLVMGHSNCGAVSAALDAVREGASFPGEIGLLAQRIEPAIADLLRELPEGSLDEAVEENSRRAAQQLATEGGILPPRLKEGRLQVAAAVHSLADGRVRLL
ncbi:MAG TPA: carbonic anhydrase [Kiloniellales bacterium]|nr:carbonic anhydrase [Kiloniellales bacterium]